MLPYDFVFSILIEYTAIKASSRSTFYECMNTVHRKGIGFSSRASSVSLFIVVGGGGGGVSGTGPNMR